MGLAHTRGFEAQVTGMARKSSSGNRRPARGRSRTARRLGRGQAQATQARRIRIEVLPSALADLDHGRQFYGQQNVAVGDYFLDALFSDIDSLALYAGIDVCTVYRVLDCRQDPDKRTDALS